METAIDMAFGGATLAVCPLSALVLSFAFYGFCGWAWESTVCAMLNHGRFANSGFLLGRVVLSMVWAALPAGCCCAGFRMPRASLSLQHSYAA